MITKFGVTAIPAWIAVSYWFLEQSFFFMLTKTSYMPIAFGAHIGGFIFGVCFYFCYNFFYEKKSDLKPFAAASEKKYIEKLNNNNTIFHLPKDINGNSDCRQIAEMILSTENPSFNISYLLHLIKCNQTGLLSCDAVYKIFECFYKLKKYEESAHLITYFINTYPNNDLLPEAYYRLGELYCAKLKKTSEGIYCLKIVETYYPDSESAFKASYLFLKYVD